MKKSQIKYEQMPYAHVLVVDDMEAHRIIVGMLLERYGIKSDFAASGFEAIDIIKSGRVYDIIFMDNMMPEIDGIETLKRIRELGYTQPVVALTADNEEGQADIFIAHGFDDFAAKPISMQRLKAVLEKYVQGEHEEQAVIEPDSPGVSPQSAESFVRDALISVEALEKLLEKNGQFEDGDMRLCAFHAHALKGASAIINEPELFVAAGKLEKAGRENNTGVIISETPAFLNELKAVIHKLMPQKKENAGIAAEADYIYLREKLLVIKEACAIYDKQAAKDAIIELRRKSWEKETQEQLNKMAGHLLKGDFDEVVSGAERMLGYST
jgi:CheY-like chemotaxis protein/HPt (histidine-containing phosphotransfer) domain-containing protein